MPRGADTRIINVYCSEEEREMLGVAAKREGRSISNMALALMKRALGPVGQDFTGRTSGWAISEFGRGPDIYWAWWARHDGAIREGRTQDGREMASREAAAAYHELSGSIDYYADALAAWYEVNPKRTVSTTLGYMIRSGELVRRPDNDHVRLRTALERIRDGEIPGVSGGPNRNGPANFAAAVLAGKDVAGVPARTSKS